MSLISAVIILYNEEKNIRRCLESIKGVVDEIIIVHDGECLDKTLEISREYTNQVFTRMRYGFMEAHLPFCLSQAMADWILRLDGDEFLSQDARLNLRRLVDQNQANAYKFLWPIFDGEKYITHNWPYKMCLFKKADIDFLGIVHYLPKVNGPLARVNYKIMHQPAYNNYSWQTFRNKWSRWAMIQAENYLTDFGKINKFNYFDSDWPNSIGLRKKIPLWLMPVEFFLTLFKTLADGAYREAVGYKIALMNAGYRVLVNYYIFKNKK